MGRKRHFRKWSKQWDCQAKIVQIPSYFICQWLDSILKAPACSWTGLDQIIKCEYCRHSEQLVEDRMLCHTLGLAVIAPEQCFPILDSFCYSFWKEESLLVLAYALQEICFCVLLGSEASRGMNCYQDESYRIGKMYCQGHTASVKLAQQFGLMTQFQIHVRGWEHGEAVLLQLLTTSSGLTAGGQQNVLVDADYSLGIYFCSTISFPAGRATDRHVGQKCSAIGCALQADSRVDLACTDKAVAWLFKLRKQWVGWRCLVCC